MYVGRWMYAFRWYTREVKKLADGLVVFIAGQEVCIDTFM